MLSLPLLILTASVVLALTSITSTTAELTIISSIVQLTADSDLASGQLFSPDGGISLFYANHQYGNVSKASADLQQFTTVETNLPPFINTVVGAQDPTTNHVYLSVGGGDVTNCYGTTNGIDYDAYSQCQLTSANSVFYLPASGSLCTMSSDGTAVTQTCCQLSTQTNTANENSGLPSDYSWNMLVAATALDGTIFVQLDAQTPSNLIYSSKDGLAWSAITLPPAYQPAFRSGLVANNATLYLFGGAIDTNSNKSREVWVSPDSGSTWVQGNDLPFGFEFNHDAPIAYKDGFVVLDEFTNSTQGLWYYKADVRNATTSTSANSTATTSTTQQHDATASSATAPPLSSGATAGVVVGSVVVAATVTSVAYTMTALFATNTAAAAAGASGAHTGGCLAVLKVKLFASYYAKQHAIHLANQARNWVTNVVDTGKFVYGAISHKEDAAAVVVVIAAGAALAAATAADAVHSITGVQLVDTDESSAAAAESTAVAAATTDYSYPTALVEAAYVGDKQYLHLIASTPAAQLAAHYKLPRTVIRARLPTSCGPTFFDDLCVNVVPATLTAPSFVHCISGDAVVDLRYLPQVHRQVQAALKARGWVIVQLTSLKKEQLKLYNKHIGCNAVRAARWWHPLDSAERYDEVEYTQWVGKKPPSKHYHRGLMLIRTDATPNACFFKTLYLWSEVQYAWWSLPNIVSGPIRLFAHAVHHLRVIQPSKAEKRKVTLMLQQMPPRNISRTTKSQLVASIASVTKLQPAVEQGVTA